MPGQKKRIHSSSSSSSPPHSDDDDDDDGVLPLPTHPLTKQKCVKGAGGSVGSNKSVRSGPSPRSLQATRTPPPPPNPVQREIRPENISSPKDQSDGIQSILRAVGGIKFTLAAVLANQEDMKSRLDKIEERLFHQDDQTMINNTNAEDIDILSCLPIKTDEEFSTLEESLNRDDFKKKLMAELKKIGRNDLKAVVYNLLPRLLTHTMAEKYSWYGAKGKKALVCCNLSAVIKDVVRCHLKEATDSAIEAPMKKWLSKAKERLQREAAKRQAAEEAAGMQQNAAADADDDLNS